ncbi:cysteine--tRNA ligase [Blastopirellula sp. JC732]|uniref:Cysteine--tRNA ligase n=1 Tax=Blastopirellula sediminis TaxID=2894196 RepID=A0A9X1MQM7_9BACT|nr:cysteine--tRNA ligase [Blastopirellula sediminis]MCC9605599.1 cysteine--tRNA ligase [Blastopirellula sediminis]MCC9631101.1 cysteine--tRNA ligase [Blastopirellula sediminis]
MTIRVYNTLSKTKEEFQTVEPGKVGIYLCGPTVYAEAHIGHMVGPVIFDTIKRYLAYSGYDVTLVVNITDVDDKLIKKAIERGISMEEVAKENIADYLHNLSALGVDQIDQMPKATETMDGIIAMVADLIEKGFAYESEGDVYFEVTKDPEYGKLTNRTVDAMQGEGGEAASRKRSPGDFALWKKAKKGEPSWKSPWGEGRPGWHIECSAMSKAILGETFDIHGGGLDLIFPHHENEIAQSECCHAKPMVKYWMHNGLLRRDSAAGKIGGRAERESDAAEDAGGKMSRSKGAGGLAKMIANQGGERIRFFLLRTHYRSTILFSEEAIAEAGVGLDSFYRLFERYERLTGESFYDLAAAKTRKEGDFAPGKDELLTVVAKHRDAYLEKMDDDFNTGGAVSELFEIARLINKTIDQQKLEENKSADLTSVKKAFSVLRELTGILGIFVKAPEKSSSGDSELVGQLMQLLIDVRATARSKKDFEMSDVIRDRLSAIGVTLEDRKEGATWRLG